MIYKNFILKHKILVDLIKKIVIKKYYKKPRPGQTLQNDLALIIDAIFYKCKTGVQWGSLTHNNIHYSVVRYHFNIWSRDNIFHICWKKILTMYQKKNKYKANLKAQSIDCSFIKSINGVDKIGRNSTDRGRNATKLSVVTDILGVPIGYLLACANEADCKLFDKTLERRIVKNKTKSNLYADKGYSNKNNKEEAEKYNLKLCVENKKNCKIPLFDTPIKEIRKNRYVCEADFSWIKNYKNVRLRYDKTCRNFDSFILISFMFVTNNKISNMNTK